MDPTTGSDAHVDVEWTVESRAGVALVTVDLSNPLPDPRQIRVENRLDGPVLPPRRQSAPEEGWIDGGYEGVVPAGGRLPLGYASPAPVERPPVAVTDEGRATESEPETTPAAVVRALGDPSPPADAVPAASNDGTERSEDGTKGGRRDVNTRSAGVDGRESPKDDTGDEPASSARRTDVVRESIPAELDAWFDDVTRRLERGKRLDGASVNEAADVLSTVGGLSGVEELEGRLVADATALRAVARRADQLAERAEETDVPVPALRRLA